MILFALLEEYSLQCKCKCMILFALLEEYSLQCKCKCMILFLLSLLYISLYI